MTVATYAARWYAQRAPGLAPATRDAYAGALRRRIVPTLGGVALVDLRRADVRAAARAWSAAGLAPATVRLTVRVLGTVLAGAVEDELLAVHPAPGLGRVLAADLGPGAARVIPSPAEVARLVAAAERVAPRLAVLVLVLARTGLRVSEAAGLRWRDVDLEARVVHVAGQWTRGAWAPPKTGRTRWVDLSRGTVAALALHRRRTPPGPWVFPSSRRRPYDRSTIEQAFRRVAATAGVPCTPHALRHAFASALLAAGEPLEYVSRALGHADAAITTRVYGRAYPYRRPAAVDRLDGVTH